MGADQAAPSRRRLHVDIERLRDPPQSADERQKFRCARIAPAPGEPDLSRIGGDRQPRIHNGVSLGDGKGRDESTALASGDHVFQSFQTRSEAIAPARGRAGGQRLLSETMPLLQQQAFVDIESIPFWRELASGGASAGANADLKEHLINHERTMILSATMPPCRARSIAKAGRA